MENVNVEGLADNVANRDMGRTHDCCDALMTQAFQSGKIVIVTTRDGRVWQMVLGRQPCTPGPWLCRCLSTVMVHPVVVM